MVNPKMHSTPRLLLHQPPLARFRLMVIVGLGSAKVLRDGRPQDLAHPYLIGKASLLKGICLTLG
jgi:hypothetical protein